jgi:hypothetical protein
VFQRIAPMERVVRIRIDHPETVQQVSLSWTDSDGDALASTRWSFDHGAPVELKTQLRARPGSYRASLTLERSGAASETEERIVTIDASSDTLLRFP